MTQLPLPVEPVVGISEERLVEIERYAESRRQLWESYPQIILSLVAEIRRLKCAS